MTTLIAQTLARLFGPSDLRILIVGLPSSGKTTALYMLKLGEVVTTIPTIGFNVETVLFKRHAFTFWDVGGCDKIRPLWRHYFQNCQALIFVVDSNDQAYFEESKAELSRLLNEPELGGTPLAVLANKQDLPHAVPLVELQKALDLDQIQGRDWRGFSAAGKTGDGLHEMLDWIIESTNRQKSSPKLGPPKAAQPSGTEEEDILTKWLSMEDDPDDIFLEKLHNYTLQSWDHRTHLRVAWLLLTRHGRREGMKQIFTSIKDFIANSPRTSRPSGTTFHETMTYFWTHMVHFAMAATKNPTGEFKTFLLLNPQLSNGGLFLHYYSKKLMLETPESRTVVALPDKRPLPSLLTDVGSLSIKDEAVAKAVVAAARTSAAPLSDSEFLEAFEARKLSSWSHEALLRLVFIKLVTLGRRHAVDSVLEALRGFQGEGFHLTIAYFWVQMMTYVLAHDYGQVILTAPAPPAPAAADGTPQLSDPGAAKSNPSPQIPSFPQLLSATTGYTALKLQELVRDPHLYLRHYSKQVIYSKQAEAELVLPDKKPLPNLLQR